MPRISIVKNFTAASNLKEGASEFHTPTNFGFQPDEVIIRQISYYGIEPYVEGLLYIWCSLTNDVIGTIHVNNASNTVYPKSCMIIKSSLPNQLQFRVYARNDEKVLVPWPNAGGEIAIQMDFIKYYGDKRLIV